MAALTICYKPVVKMTATLLSMEEKSVTYTHLDLVSDTYKYALDMDTRNPEEDAMRKWWTRKTASTQQNFASQAIAYARSINGQWVQHLWQKLESMIQVYM
jgi:hypothetical protein